MNIIKNRGIKYSEYIVETVGYYFMDNNNLEASVETFYNCRELGYVLRINDRDDYNKAMCIWIYSHRNSDNPTITWDYINIPKENANMFSEESWIDRTFSGNIEEVSMKAIDIIKEYFERQMIQMEELKRKMIEEINNYIVATNDYELINFISRKIVSYMNENKKELMWYPTKYDENNFVIDIEIENV